VHQSTDWTPDVIILDINMDEHDEYQTARVLRRLPMTRNAVLIARRFPKPTSLAKPSPQASTHIVKKAIVSRD
jgi:CheY-like chemotaxis protein